MRKDHRPYFIKKAYLNFQKFYTRHFLCPRFQVLGKGFVFIKPWHVEIFGAPITIGNYAVVIATSDNKVRLSVWPQREGQGRISIGDFSMICPGVRISSASAVEIGHGSMIASRVYITDSDWHGVYNRISFGKTAPVVIEDNVWIGDSAIICKGVTIGKNSIVGAGAVVVDSIPADSIAVGNPARVVRALDPGEQITTRAQWYADPDRLFEEIDQWDRAVLKDNTLLSWLRSVLFPTKKE